MKSSLSERLAAYVDSIEFKDISHEAIHRTKQLFLDYAYEIKRI
jgi:2-methylcitrate dehydratase PrpD